MMALEDILSQEIVQKWGWTLLHFVWQAAVAALLLTIQLRVLRKSTANLRYVLACLTLGLIVLLPVITLHLVPISASYPTAPVEPAPVPSVLPMEEAKQVPVAEMPVLEKPVKPVENVAITPRVSWKQRAVELLEPALPYIVSGWLVGVFGLSLWHLGGWTQMQRLRRRMVKQIGPPWQSKLKELAKLLGIRRVVQLMESALVQVPTVVGWLRPVILLPASALTGLSSEQLEAILAHELAHIRRYDYLVNMLQTVVEILGFYHPAVWWVSHRIRIERENCCDDLAVTVSGDRVRYARALTSLEEVRSRQGELAVAATGGILLKRIRRLVGTGSVQNSHYGWAPAVIAVLLILALAIPATVALTSGVEKIPEGLCGSVIEGIRANRDKFECGVLAWSSKQITTRFADSNRPATELAGQYELWWDGNKKIATKYVRDEVHKDPEGNFRVEKGQGGTSYDGGVLSWKPDFHSDNWLGPEVTCWRGRGSRDWQILIESNMENIRKEWSVVETNGVELIRLMGKNMDETATDYGGYGIEYYDPSKGYGLVNEEWYNPDGSPRMKHTVKLLEVIPGGWFPVEVDFKFFAITDGKVHSHNHYALDIERCSFNDKSALPKGIFKLGMEKQLKYQEKLQKYLAMELRGLSDVKEAAKADKVKRGAREAIEKFVASAMAGDLEKAGKYAHPDRLPANQIADITEIAKGQNLWIMAVVADDFSAIAVSSVIQGDHSRMGPLVFCLDRIVLNGRDNWWVHDIDMETPDRAEVELKQFLKEHPEAKKVPSENKTDVPVEVERTISPKLVMLLGAINSCGAETELNIESISITARNISIRGDTSGRTNTQKFLDAIRKNELEVLQLRLDARDNRDKFSIIVDPEKDWQQRWRLHKNDVQLGVEETISPKLVMLLGAINSCAADTELNIESVSITARNINIKGDTSSRTNSQKFLDSIKKNELEVLRLNLDARNNRDRFSMIVKPKKDWQQWWQQHKTDVGIEVEKTSQSRFSTTLPNGVTVEQPATIRVPEDYPTAYAAVKAAKAGDTIVISADRYRGEDILIEPKLEIEVEKTTSNNSGGDSKRHQHVTFKEGMSIREALRFLGKAHKKNIILSDKVAGQVPVNELYNVTFEEVLQAILGTHKYIIDGGFIRVYTEEEFESIYPEKKTNSQVEVEKPAVQVEAERDVGSKLMEDVHVIEGLMPTIKLAIQGCLGKRPRLPRLHKKPGPGILKGMVRDTADTSYHRAYLFFVPVENWPGKPVFYYLATVNESFEITGVPRGGYYLFAIEARNPNSIDAVGLPIDWPRPVTIDANRKVAHIEIEMSTFLSKEVRFWNVQGFLRGVGHLNAENVHTEELGPYGRVVDAKGNPVPYATVQVREFKPNRSIGEGIAAPDARTNEQGYYGLRPLDYSYYVSAIIYTPLIDTAGDRWQYMQRNKVFEGKREVNFEFGPWPAEKEVGSRIEGIVVDVNNTPIPSFIVDVRPAKPWVKVNETSERWYERWGFRAAFNAGKFTLGDVPEGICNVRVMSHESSAAQGVTLGKREITVSAGQAIYLKFQVEDWEKKRGQQTYVTPASRVPDQQPSKTKDVKGQNVADVAVYWQLNEVVDLSQFTPEMPFREAIEKLKNSVEPPLKIIVLWRDLFDTADIEPTTPINMDAISAVRLGTALKLLLMSVSSGFADLDYVVEDGVITIATKESLPSKLETRVYDIFDLVDTALDPNTGKVASYNEDDANDILQHIIDTVEPDSWYQAGGEGRIAIYKGYKLIVLQTREIHQKVEQLLSGIRASPGEQGKRKPAIEIESRLLVVSEDFLEDIGLDANSIYNADGKFKPAIVESPASPISETYSLILDDPNVSFLLRATQAHEDSKVLITPKVTVFDGKEAAFSIHKQVNYISGYAEPNLPSGEPEPKRDSVKIGTWWKVNPKITPDNKHILLSVDFELSNLLGFEERMYKEKYPYKIPQMEVVSAKTRVSVPNGGAVLIGGQKIAAEKDGRKVQKEILVLIKAKKVDSESRGAYGGGYSGNPDPLGLGYGGYAPGYGGFGGGMGGYGGGMGGYGGGGFGGVGPPVPDKETDSEDSNTPAMGYGGYGGYRAKRPEDPNSADANSPENRP